MKKKGMTVLVGTVCAVVIMSMTTLYVKKVENSIRTSILANLSELTDHDVKTVEGHISRSWGDLENIANRLSYTDFENIEDAQSFLTLERSSSLFSGLYLVSETGEAYSDILTRLEPDEHDFNSNLAASTTSQFVAWNKNYKEAGDDKKSYLLYGVELAKPIKVADTWMTAIVGQAKITDIREQLLIESYDGLGNSRIVDADGNYIVLPFTYTAANSFENIWDVIASEQYAFGSETIAAIRQQFDNGEEFSYDYVDPKQGNVSLIFHPMDISGANGWYFITQVSEELFKAQSKELVYLNIFQILVVAIALFALLFLILFNRSKTMKAQATAEARTEFLSTMSHEIRTPLNGIISLCHQMREHIDEPDRLQTYLVKLTKTSEYLVSLVSDILDMNKIQAGKFACDLGPVDLEGVIKTVSDMQLEPLSQKKINYVLDTEFKDPFVITDKLHLKQVLMNLLSNACKFTPEEGTITLKLRQRADGPGQVWTTISVTDTGVGISRDFQKVIFDSFTQERNKMSGSIKGTGLGLTISAKLMELLGGSLSVESEPGHGSCFTLQFPAEIVSDPAVISTLREEVHKKVSLDEIGVLIAEDNLLNGEILQEILQESGARADWVTDGAQALMQIRNQPPGTYDVVLMDIRMPNMGGMEAARAIRALKREDLKDLLIFACTADSLSDTLEESRSCGMDGFLSKPVDIDEMLEKINEVKK